MLIFVKKIFQNPSNNHTYIIRIQLYAVNFVFQTNFLASNLKTYKTFRKIWNILQPCSSKNVIYLQADINVKDYFLQNKQCEINEIKILEYKHSLSTVYKDLIDTKCNCAKHIMIKTYLNYKRPKFQNI